MSDSGRYDLLHLCLRPKDAIFTFNWDPFLMQSRIRLARLGVTQFPALFFLHGNITVGYCETDDTSGLLGRDCRTRVSVGESTGRGEHAGVLRDDVARARIARDLPGRRVAQ